MNQDEWLNGLINNQIDYLKKTLLTTKNLEVLLRFCHKLKPYSIRNVLLLMAQTNGVVDECHGTDEWQKKFSTKVLAGAKPLYIYAPKGYGKQREFCIAATYDIRDTDRKYLTKVAMPQMTEHINLINSLAIAMSYKLVLAQFKSGYKYNVYVDNAKHIIYINSQIAMKTKCVLALKELSAIHIENSIRTGKRKPVSDALKKSLAVVSAFEISDWLNENPPKINRTAKEILLSEGLLINNLKDGNNIAYQLIKQLEDILIKGIQNNSQKLFS